MATEEQIEAKLQELIERLHESDEAVRGSLRDSLPEARVLTLHLPDLDADYWVELADGSMGPLHRGTHDDAHIRVGVDSDQLIDLIDGRSHLVPAYLTGSVRIEADFADILRLRRML